MIIQIILAIVITITVLLQKSSSIGLGAYSGSNESLFGAKGPTGFLSKFTFIAAFLFVINTLTLGYFYSKENTASVTDTITTKSASIVPATTEKPATNAPVAPVAPETKK